MKTTHSIVFIFFFLAVLPTVLPAQIDIKKEGDKFFKKGMYTDALYYYEQLPDNELKGKLLYQSGLTHFYANRLPKAIQLLASYNNKFPKDKDGLIALASAYHHNQEYKKAVHFYKSYLNKVNGNPQERQRIISEIKKCAYGIRHQYSVENAFVENIGENVNGPYDELNPIQSPNNPNKYYFSASRIENEGGRRNSEGIIDEVFGSYKLDMYSSTVINGSWQYPQALNPLLNSSQNDLIVDFNREGNILYYVKSLSADQGPIMVDTFSTENEPDLFPDPFVSPVVGELGDIYLRVFNDSTFIFASNREGGYGGYDLYVTSLSNGIYIEPVNLGPDVNSAYDEITPSISKDGQELFFSSNRLNSFGGYDIFSIRYNREGMFWNEAKNLGIGINSPADELYYSLAADGTSGVFSSNRRSGIGGFDLYIAYLKERKLSNDFVSKDLGFYDPSDYKLTSDSITTDSTALIATVPSTSTVKTQPEENLIERESRSINLEPFYYGEDDYMLTPANQTQLKALLDVMTIFPETRIHLTSYALKEGLPEFDLYFSIKRAEKLEEYLVSKGINKDRILLLGVGSNYPLVKEVVGGVPSNLAKKVNRRVEIKIVDKEGLPLVVSYEEPVVADYLKAKEYDLYKSVNEGISFKVKIAEVNQLYKNPLLRNFNDVMIEQHNGAYLYTVGLYNDFFTALGVKKRLVNDGFESEVIAYKDGVLLSEDQLQGLASTNREIKRLLESR